MTQKHLKQLKHKIASGGAIGSAERLALIKLRRSARRQHQEPEPEASNNLTQIETESTQI